MAKKKTAKKTTKKVEKKVHKRTVDEEGNTSEWSEGVEEKEEPRKRQRGAGVKCPKCECDMFVKNSKTHPEFLRQRFWKCAKCEFILQKLSKDTL